MRTTPPNERAPANRRVASPLGAGFHFVLTPLERMHIPVRAFRDDGHIHQFISAAQSYVKTDAAKSL